MHMVWGQIVASTLNILLSRKSNSLQVYQFPPSSVLNRFTSRQIEKAKMSERRKPATMQQKTNTKKRKNKQQLYIKRIYWKQDISFDGFLYIRIWLGLANWQVHNTGEGWLWWGHLSGLNFHWEANIQFNLDMCLRQATSQSEIVTDSHWTASWIWILTRQRLDRGDYVLPSDSLAATLIHSIVRSTQCQVYSMSVRCNDATLY